MSSTRPCSTLWPPAARGSSASSPSRSARTDDKALSATLWDLVWSGPDQQRHPHAAPGAHPLRHAQPPHQATARPAADGLDHRPGGASLRTGPPETAGRWALLPQLDTDPTRRAHAAAERLLDRHGVVIRGAVVSERQPGGFAAVYKVLSAFEDSGRCRRGYFVEGLGAAQFGTAGAIDRLRTFSEVDDGGKPTAVCLAATDPANPYGAALPWPDSDDGPTTAGHRPGRKAGALVVMVDGAAGPLRRARRPHPAHLERRRRPARRRRPRRWPRRPGAARWAGSPSSGPTARPCSAAARRPLREALDAAGFVATPRGAEAACLRATPSTAPPQLLDRSLSGQRLNRTDFRVPQHATADLSGGTVVETVSRGKHLLTRIDRGADRWTLHTHLKMEGAWKVLTPRPAVAAPGTHRPGRPRDRAGHGGRVLARHRRAARPRGRGRRRRAPRPRPARPRLGRGARAANLARDPERPTPRGAARPANLAGIGNLYAAELCFTSGVHPQTPVAAVPDLRRLVRRAHQMLELNKERPYQSTTGDLRERERMWVYRRDRSPCRRCGTPVVVEMQGPAGRERASYWCPSCQPYDTAHRGTTPPG